MSCAFCDGQTSPRKVTAQHWLNGKLYIVENVKAEVCRQCGERYFHAKTLDAIDRRLLRKHNVKKTLRVEVVAF